MFFQLPKITKRKEESCDDAETEESRQEDFSTVTTNMNMKIHNIPFC